MAQWAKALAFKGPPGSDAWVGEKTDRKESSAVAY